MEFLGGNDLNNKKFDTHIIECKRCLMFTLEQEIFELRVALIFAIV